MKHRYSRYLEATLLIGDILSLNLGFLIAYLFLFKSLVGFNTYPNLEIIGYINLVWLTLVILAKPYKIPRTSRVTHVIRHAFRFIIIHLLVVSSILLLNQNTVPDREYIVLSYVFFTIIIFASRITYLYAIRIYRKYGFNYRNVAVVGYGEVAEEIRKFFRLHPEFGYRFIGYFDDKNDSQKIIGKVSSLQSFLEKNRLDELYCCLPYVEYKDIQRLINLGEKNYVKVKLIADFRGFEYKGLEIETYENIPVLNVTSFPLDEVKNRFLKRTLDIAFSLTILMVFFSWLFPLIAIAIKLDSKGPVFFKQVRTGKGNSNFWCWKFRTMYVNDESDKKQASPNDDRITSVGRFLRKTSLDELPQFLNVLIGNMSVVGPRPHMLHHTREYSKKVERFMARHFVKPGITGLAQTKGYRGETQKVVLMKNRVKFDRFYIENWSIFLDLKIIFLTMISFLRGDKNAY